MQANDSKLPRGPETQVNPHTFDPPGALVRVGSRAWLRFRIATLEKRTRCSDARTSCADVLVRFKLRLLLSLHPLLELPKLRLRQK